MCARAESGDFAAARGPRGWAEDGTDRHVVSTRGRRSGSEISLHHILFLSFSFRKLFSQFRNDVEMDVDTRARCISAGANQQGK